MELGQPIEEASFFFETRHVFYEIDEQEAEHALPRNNYHKQAQGMLIPSLVFYSTQISVFLIAEHHSTKRSSLFSKCFD